MKKTILILMLLMIGVVSAVTLQSNLNLTTETKNILEGVGKGIGTITKERMLFDENGTNYANETYIDTLKMLENGCNGDYCEFVLFESQGINKKFRIELESICAKEGICIEFEEEYNCCLEWRAETDEEVLAKAEIKAEQILNNIASITLDREARSKVKRFEERKIII